MNHKAVPILTGKPGGSCCCKNLRSLLNCLNGAMASRTFSSLCIEITTESIKENLKKKLSNIAIRNYHDQHNKNALHFILQKYC